METIKLGTVNGTEISAFNNGNEFLVPIKPICTALGVDDRAQRAKIQDNPYLAPTGVLSTLVGANDSTREMFCLQLFYIPGWLFSINPKNVKADAREKVEKYQWECYNILYRHFFGDFIESNSMGQRAREIKKEIEEIRNSISENKSREHELKSKLRDLESQLEDVTGKMINPERHLFNT